MVNIYSVSPTTKREYLRDLWGDKSVYTVAQAMEQLLILNAKKLPNGTTWILENVK